MLQYDDIQAFVKGLCDGHEDRAIMKLVVLGKGQIGKSTLVNYLKHVSKSQLKVFQALS